MKKTFLEWITYSKQTTKYKTVYLYNSTRRDHDAISITNSELMALKNSEFQVEQKLISPKSTKDKETLFALLTDLKYKYEYFKKSNLIQVHSMQELVSLYMINTKN